MTVSAKIRIAIVDDHPLFRQGLKQVVLEDRRFELVGEAASGKEAIELIGSHKPELVVLDINLPDMTGLDVAAILRERSPGTRCVVLTMLKDEQAFNRAMNLGIGGYVLKENAATEIVACLIAVAAGNPYVSPSLTAYLLRRNERVDLLTNRQPGLTELTTAERRILKRIAEKKSTKEIAQELEVSPRTIETHRANISSKLGLKGSNSLLQFALEHRDTLSSLA
jgi:DNA-binding NarL/FixJ family response regulator